MIRVYHFGRRQIHERIDAGTVTPGIELNIAVRVKNARATLSLYVNVLLFALIKQLNISGINLVGGDTGSEELVVRNTVDAIGMHHYPEVFLVIVNPFVAIGLGERGQGNTDENEEYAKAVFHGSDFQLK